MNSFFYKYVQFRCLRWVALLCMTFNSSYAADHVYVTNSFDSSVSVIEVPANTVVATVSVGSSPSGISATPNGSFVYVACSRIGSVYIIETATNTVVGTVDVSADGGTPAGVAVTPNGNFVYVTSLDDDSVSVINTSNNTLVTTVSVGSRPFGVAITPDSSFAYVTNNSSDSVSVIATSSNTVVDTIVVGTNPFGIAITPDGAFAYVVNNGSNSISVINTSTNAIVDSISLTDGLYIAISPDGAFAYVTNTVGNVSIIDIASNAIVGTIPMGGNPVGVIFGLPNGTFSYVANGGLDEVQVINTSNNTIVATIPVGSSPAFLAYVTSVLPPVSLDGAQKINDFALVYEIYNTLRWTPSPSEGVTGYNVYRDGVLIATLGPDSLSYQDHNRPKVDALYSVTAMLGSSESSPISILVKSK